MVTEPLKSMAQNLCNKLPVYIKKEIEFHNFKKI